MNSIITTAILIFSPMFAFAERLSPTHLLDNYAAARHSLPSFVIKGKDVRETTDTAYGDQYKYFKLEEFELRADSARVDLTMNTYHNLQGPDDKASAAHRSRMRVIWDGATFSTSTYRIAPKVSEVFISKREDRKTGWLDSGYAGAPLDGVFIGDRQPVDIILRNASDIAIRSGMEQVNGTNCYVIDATTSNGKYNLWIDPEHGYNIAKAKVHKSGSDILYDKPVNQHGAQRAPEGFKYGGTFHDRRSEFLFELEVVEFKRIGAAWLPVEATTQVEHRYVDGRIMREKQHHKRTHIDPNPDFEAIRAFVPDFPEGARVTLEEAPGIRYTWQNGHLVANVDKLVIDQLDQATREIMAEGSVPPTLTSVGNAATPDVEPNTAGTERTNVIEAQPNERLKPRAFSTLVFIVVGVLAITFIGWKAFGRLIN